MAKTASKNNPSTRVAAKDTFYNGKKVKPARFEGESVYMIAVFEDGMPVLGADGTPMPYASVMSAVDNNDTNPA